MQILNTNYMIKKTHSNEYLHNINFRNEIQLEKNYYKIEDLKKILKICKNKKMLDDDKLQSTQLIIDKLISDKYEYDVLINKDFLKNTIEKFINFFKDFEINISSRFLNTFLNLNKNTRINYIINYFRLMNDSDVEIISKKFTSPEFKQLNETIDLLLYKYNYCLTKINNRLKIYFGEPGTGKTTKALKETNLCIVCNNSMIPSDLMENFKFNNGKPGFEKSDLWLAMEQGKKIIFDEINLLPFDSLRFLQSLLDNKEKINYKGIEINIKDGFEIIGTMNLELGNTIYTLPEPLVDRCSDIVEFKLNLDDLMSYSFQNLD